MDNTEHFEGAELATSDDLDGYDVDVETAAQLLGIGTTRLSQITSRGSLSFQRRKVGFRNRMFYRKTELLEYLERQFPASAQFKSHVLAERWNQPGAETEPGTELVNLAPLVDAIGKLQEQSRPRVTPRATKSRELPTAVSLREKFNLSVQLDNVIAELSLFRQALSRVEKKLDSLQKEERALQHQSQKPQSMQCARASASAKTKDNAKAPKWPRVHKNNSHY